MPFAAVSLNTMLAAWGALATHMSLHTAYSTSGANELTGGTPAYARQALTWDAPASGAMALSGSPVFNVPAGSVPYAGFWSASTSGTYYGMAPLTGPSVTALPKAFTASGTGDTITAPGHGLTDGATVTVFPGLGATVPTGLSAGTVYYVRDVSGSTLKLAATSGGAAIDLGDGAGIITPITVHTYADQGTLTVSDPAVGSMATLI